jgi:hypothetical protein
MDPNYFEEAPTGAVEGRGHSQWRRGGSKWNPGGSVCKPIAADSHHFVEEQDPDPHYSDADLQPCFPELGILNAPRLP